MHGGFVYRRLRTESKVVVYTLNAEGKKKCRSKSWNASCLTSKSRHTPIRYKVSIINRNCWNKTAQNHVRVLRKKSPKTKTANHKHFVGASFLFLCFYPTHNLPFENTIPIAEKLRTCIASYMLRTFKSCEPTRLLPLTQGCLKA